MSDIVVIEIVRAVPVLISAALSFVAAILSFRNGQHIKEGRAEVAVVHNAVNGGLADAKLELREAHVLLAEAVSEIKDLKQAAKEHE